jgi:hypothetical protein
MEAVRSLNRKKAERSSANHSSGLILDHSSLLGKVRPVPLTDIVAGDDYYSLLKRLH